MYPVIRLAKEFFLFRNAEPLGVFDTHVSHHVCWPWDLDLWMELNNGRTLTIYDLGRLPFAKRTGLVDVLRRKRWGLTMAGASVRYRRRVRMFETMEIRSKALCWDERFIYLEQSMWVKGAPASSILYRSAVTGKDGIVPPSQVVEELGHDIRSPEPPLWVAEWIKAEAHRPWPPNP